MAYEHKYRPHQHYLYDGEAHSLTEWCRLKGLNYQAVHRRIVKRGWTVALAFETPVPRRGGQMNPNSLRSRARAHGLSYTMVRDRLRRGWSTHDALMTPPHGKRPV